MSRKYVTQNMSRKIWISWSSGKDSAYALYHLRRQVDVEVTGLMTTINQSFARVAMHAVRETLLEQQAQALGLPLYKINIPYPCSNELYEAQMQRAIEQATDAGVTHMMFGDLFLGDIKQYRERMLEPTSIRSIFPLWGYPTAQLARQIIAEGFKAVITCVDPKQLPATFAGRKFDEDFLRDLPPTVDPCGERGEFHTFVYDGPIFGKPIAIINGPVIARDGFIFADLLPADRCVNPA